MNTNISPNTLMRSSFHMDYQLKDMGAGKREFEGYASVFNSLNSYGTRVKKGAFKKTLSERKGKIKIMYNHSDVIGKPIALNEDQHGLYVHAAISETTLGNDVIQLMRDQVLDEMSIGFNVLKYEVDDTKDSADPVIDITEVKLWEISVVPWGADPATEVVKVYSMEFDEPMNTELIEAIKALSAEIVSLNSNFAYLNPSGLLVPASAVAETTEFSVNDTNVIAEQEQSDTNNSMEDILVSFKQTIESIKEDGYNLFSGGNAKQIATETIELLNSLVNSSGSHESASEDEPKDAHSEDPDLFQSVLEEFQKFAGIGKEINRK